MLEQERATGRQAVGQLDDDFIFSVEKNGRISSRSNRKRSRKDLRVVADLFPRRS